MKEFRKLKSLKFLYEINKDGVLRNVKSKKIKVPYYDKNGYLRYSFQQKSLLEGENISTMHKMQHRLLAEAFIPNEENKPTVDHIDRNPRNNKLENLRWATYTEQANNRNHSEHGKETIRHAFEARKQSCYCIDEEGNKKEFESFSSAGKYIKENFYPNSRLDTIQKTIPQVIKRKRNFVYKHFWFIN